VSALLVLLSTAWQVLTGTQLIRNAGDLARFGALVFQILVPLELVVCVFLATVLAALAVSQEKDRHTLVLLLLSDLSAAELVLGELFAGILGVLLLVVAAVPFPMLLALLGGISFGQIGRSVAVIAMSVLVCGSLGSTLAFWREKTFQTLAITTLAMIFWTVAWELVARGALGTNWNGIATTDWAATFSPWHAILQAARPRPGNSIGGEGWFTSIGGFLIVSALASGLLNLIAIWRVRAWNSSPEVRQRATDVDAHGAKPTSGTKPVPLHTAQTRSVWSNPILWREICTWAYGRKVIAVRLAYLLLFGFAAYALQDLNAGPLAFSREEAALRLVPLAVLSLLLINAQSVTSVTSERDGQSLDLLLVTDLTPKEFVYGKLVGVLYNTKEMILLPAALGVYLGISGTMSLENTGYLIVGWLTLTAFAAILGIHSGMAYASSRAAISVSLGTLFFLFIGVATCMRIMVAFSGSFSFQLQPFLAAMLGGFVGLYLALGARNPSPAITAAAFFCPLATLYLLTSFLLGYTLAVFLVLVAAYGFTAAALLIPAIHEFDVATARPPSDE
jgi:ABC-type transport system involved in multi-copper enzyme maturation permease subunit